MFKRLVTTLIVIVAASAVIYAEDPYAIVDKYLEITKAKQKLDSIQTYKYSAMQNLINPNTGQKIPLTLKYWFKKDSNYRLETEYMGNKQVSATDQKIVWGTDQRNPAKFFEKTGAEADYWKFQFKFLDVVNEGLVNYKEDSTKFEFVETLTLDEKQLNKIKVIEKDAEKGFFLYIDAISSLIYQFEIPAEKGFTIFKIVSYTKSSGYFVPQKLEQWDGENKSMEIIFQSYTINPKIDDRFFGLPENK